MTIQIDLEDKATLSIEEFVAEARRANLHDETELVDLAPAMRRLSNNKEFLEQFILQGLEDVRGFQQDNLYSSQSYILREVTRRSFLRFAIWAPLGFGEEIDEKNFYSYEHAHNHDFSLLTAGFLGPGYRTTINELLEMPRGFIGEPVHFGPERTVQLSPGRVLLYEAGKDVHVQHPPEGLSVSLNLIVDQADRFPEQLYFDVPGRKVAGYVGNVKLKRSTFMRYAAALDTARCRAAIDRIACSHPCEITRIYAYRAQSLMTGEDKARRGMAKDPSPLVRNSVHLLDDGFAQSLIWG